MNLKLLSCFHLSFYSRWKESEQRLAQSQGFVLDEDQLKQDWAAVLALADQTGRSLEQIHIFALAHILRRPIIVYGVRVVKNYRGENLGFANFEGVHVSCVYMCHVPGVTWHWGEGGGMESWASVRHLFYTNLIM